MGFFLEASNQSLRRGRAKREARLRAYVPAIHVLLAVEDVDARDKPGHDG